MKSAPYLVGFVTVFILPAILFAGSFQVYPGARVEDIYEIKQPEFGGKMSKPPKVIVFTTNDFFENVVAFYSGLGREYRLSGTGGRRGLTLPSGQELREAYFIFDNASDLSTSKHWVKIQRPYFARDQGVGLKGKSGAPRDVTAIIEEDRRSYP